MTYVHFCTYVTHMFWSTTLTFRYVKICLLIFTYLNISECPDGGWSGSGLQPTSTILHWGSEPKALRYALVSGPGTSLSGWTSCDSQGSGALGRGSTSRILPPTCLSEARNRISDSMTLAKSCGLRPLLHRLRGWEQCCWQFLYDVHDCSQTLQRYIFKSRPDSCIWPRQATWIWLRVRLS